MPLTAVERFASAPGVRLYQSAVSAPPKGPEDGTVSFGSYNVKNLFDEHDQDPSRGTTEKPQRELEALAEVLLDSQVDVVALQEVENLEVLETFLEEFLPDQYQHAVLVEGNDARGIDVAVISKFPVTDVVSHKDNEFPLPEGGTTKFRRDLLRVDLEVGEYPFSVYTAHLKSKRGGESSRPQRMAEAAELRRVVEEEMKPFDSRWFVVTGDLNDSPLSDTVGLIRDGDPALVDPLEGKAWEERDTWPARRPRRQLDYVLFPEHMTDDLVSAEVLHHPRASTASDHLMVKATFKLP